MSESQNSSKLYVLYYILFEAEHAEHNMFELFYTAI